MISYGLEIVYPLSYWEILNREVFVNVHDVSVISKEPSGLKVSILEHEISKRARKNEIEQTIKISDHLVNFGLLQFLILLLFTQLAKQACEKHSNNFVL